jgi:UDP-3-O-[3-hydroxymyristoyl] glucosamine N-acyltransferase
MEFTAEILANLLGGEVKGDSDAVVNKLCKIEEGESGGISFLSNPAYTEYIYATKASVVIVDNTFDQEKPVQTTLVVVDSARDAFAKLLETYSKYKHSKTGVEDTAFTAESATIGEDVYLADASHVGDNSIVGNNSKVYHSVHIGNNVKIGENCIFHPGCRVLDESIIGNDCIIQPGAIIGGDGFGFIPNSENNYQKIVHTGNVILEDFVEIGANTTIDRATLGSTVIKKGVKLDNLIQVGHNVEIGENTVIAAQTGIAGSTKIGKNCMIGGQVGIVGHITIADEVKIAAQSGVGNSIEKKGTIVQGSPAFEIHDYKKSYVTFRRLPQIKKQLDELTKELEALKQSAK